ncbi:hypothetical protein QZH41_013723 [Actinostola sp. cb2023]|nr:hypothetical protein QZH41_013723 [Actinostola sp. cb2023]
MEAQPKRCRTYFIPLHILHVCLSIGLIVAVVHNQLVNDARFEKLERKCDCKSSDETSVDAKRIKQDNDYWNAGKSEYGPDVQTKPRSIVRRTSAVELNPSFDNYTNVTELRNNKSASIGRVTNDTLNGIEAIEEDNKTKTIHEKDYLQSGRPLRGSKGCELLQAAPSFHPSPKSLVFNERQTAVLSCSAKANPSAQITWYRDNMLISGERDSVYSRYSIKIRDVTPQASQRAIKYCPSEIPHPVTQSTLMIKNSNGSDTGTYVCKARNILGTFSYKTHILIQVYVQFTTLPSNITVVQGENVQLSCRASGVPAPTITWYRNDGCPMPLQYNVDKGDLHILNISKEEEWTFVCLATNVLGSKTTEATVTVNVFPEITSFLDHVITINESNTLVLPCNATGYPIPNLRWFKTGDSLPEDRHSYDSQLLNITSVRYKDRGEYVCTANNTAGTITKKVNVLVQVGPKIIRRPNATEFGYLSNTKRLHFQVFSLPKVKVTWKRLYWDRMNDARFREENGSLVIDNVQYTDSGLYQAVARNILGEVRITTFLAVKDPAPPSVYSSLKNFVLNEGEAVILSCNATANPSAQITWYRDSKMLSGQRDNPSYRIVNRDITPLGLLRAQSLCPSELPNL